MRVDRDTANKQWEICQWCGIRTTFESVPLGRRSDPEKEAEVMVPVWGLKHGA